MMRSRTRFAAVGAALMTLTSTAACLSGSAEPIAFTRLPGAHPQGHAADIGDPAARERFLGALPAATRKKIGPTLQQGPADGMRRLGFVFAGCRAISATLTITPDQVHPEQEVEGGGTVKCDVAEYFVAVFDVEASEIPAGAKLG